MSAPQSILICRLSALGDIVLSQPVAAGLRAAYPDAHIAYLARRPLGRILSACAEIDALHEWEGGHAGLPPGVAEREWELVVDLSATGRSRRLLRGVRRQRVLRASKQSVRRRALVMCRALGTWRFHVDPAVDRTLSVLKKANIPVLSRRPRLAVNGTPNPSRVLLAPGGGRALKRWAPSRFSGIGRRVTEAGGSVVIAGAADERALLEEVAGGIPQGSVEIRAGEDPERLPEVVAECGVALTNDSGLLHVAEAVGVPVVAVFGATHPDLGFGPLDSASTVIHTGISCSPCDIHGPNRCRYAHGRCLTDISEEQVWLAVESRMRSEAS
ncbi:MAG: glycosyltransferase family 9 protein [Gemmatimonadota bacterium]|jgi:ADP-heptose:LPS heptosyltransferase|nr:hypothetical protein [Gemmatimonadota bacterium]MDP6528927.1 glycosyltransferase family 9 protein [Gemmatimonadota bacterium]MDP6803220.1 glycosyltransferase family 9 protein [Gemmatimonadota bacterium]MDP7032685.1 glycosyltransferase family 9 protein [Gemmatimonadota bacterium]